MEENTRVCGKMINSTVKEKKSGTMELKPMKESL